MTSAKQVILTAINFKGIAQVKTEAATLAENLMCSTSYVNSIIKKVETGKITIKY